jgi:hypothetical protein
LDAIFDPVISSTLRSASFGSQKSCKEITILGVFINSLAITISNNHGSPADPPWSRVNRYCRCMMSDLLVAIALVKTARLLTVLTIDSIPQILNKTTFLLTRLQLGLPFSILAITKKLHSPVTFKMDLIK